MVWILRYPFSLKKRIKPNTIIGRNDRGHVQIWRAPSWAQIEVVEKGQTQ